MTSDDANVNTRDNVNAEDDVITVTVMSSHFVAQALAYALDFIPASIPRNAEDVIRSIWGILEYHDRKRRLREMRILIISLYTYSSYSRLSLVIEIWAEIFPKHSMLHFNVNFACWYSQSLLSTTLVYTASGQSC